MNLAQKLVCLSLLVLSPLVHAEGGHGTFGLNVGVGLPLLAEGGLNVYFGPDLGLDIDYGQIEISSGEAKAKLSLPAVLVKYHPFSGNYFIAAGVGRSTIDATGTDAQSGQTAEVKTDSTAVVAKTGWMWGANNGGLWFGMDLEYVAPLSSTTTITSALPPTDPAYRDAKDNADKYGKQSYFNITLARIGYLF